MEINNQIFFFLHSLAHQSNFFDSIIIFCAEYLPYIVAVWAGLYLLVRHKVILSPNPFKEFRVRWREMRYVLFSSIASLLASLLIKSSFQIERPFHQFKEIQSLFLDNGFSFPSSHTAFFSALAFSIFFYHKKAGTWFLIGALVIGLSRIIAGVHFPVDILGGVILGFLVAFFLKKR